MNIKNIKYYIITGFISILPVIATYWIFIKLIDYFSKPGVIFLEMLFNDNIPQYLSQLTGIIFTFIFIYFIGLLVSNVIGKRIYSWIEKMFTQIPVVNTVYKTIKQFITSISNSKKNAFKKVVLIEYPRLGIWTMAMVTGESKNRKNKLFYHIFVPTTPNPTSGFMLYIPQKDVQETDISIEEGLKIIISGGMLGAAINKIDNNSVR